ncbi:thymidine phosphorylase [Pseudomonas sp. TTU2014-105ASC]|nr:thymidine phosphorylase [Pseudomonas sp. TTU2014-105ASC]
MRTDAKVVQLNKAAPEHKPSSPAGRLPVALISVRDKAAQQLRQALQSLFDNADDSLFEIADRATSNVEQNAFFEAMRDLRMKRRNIERGFLQQLFEAFAKLNQYEIGKPPAMDEVSFDSLSLVQNDDLEASVAIDTMVAKVMSRAAQPLGHLTTRMNALISKKLDDKSNPLGPHALCDYFIEASSSLGVEIKVKLIIFKLFEKYVLGDLDQLYAEANQTLVAAGILPELQSAAPRRQQRPGAPAGSHTPSAPLGHAVHADEGLQEAAFSALHSLLSELRGSSALPARNIPNDAIPISSGDLLRLLSHMQTRAPQTVDDFDLQQQLGSLLSRVSAKSGKSRVVGEIDDDVINLVSMLFEFILDDRTLPDSLKALIGRLQIPLLKVAVLDKTFFSRGSHPARRLLNEIASAAMGWGDQDEAHRDSLYQKIEQIVARLLNDFVDDPAIFSELLADFLAFIGDERRRSELLEQRTRDAEEGRAKAEIARQEVEYALNQRLLGKTLPEVVVRLLQEAWSKVLLLTCLKHGTQSEEWQAALDTMDDLVWSVTPHEDDESRARLLELVPSLLKALRDGLVSAAFDPFSTGSFFTQLEALHVQTLQRFQQPQNDPDEIDLNGDGAAQITADTAPTMVEVVDEIVLLAPGESREQEPEISLPDNDQALIQVDNLRVGSWVEFQEDEEHKLRCKLAAVIKPTGKYIFVNRTGMKVLEKTRMGLATEFQRGAIRLLNDTLLFDRALESVIGNLRKLKNT